MLLDKPFIHCFETGGNYYIYDVNKNSVIRVNKEISDYLNSGKEKIVKESFGFEARNTVEELKQQGYFSSKRVNEIENPVSEILDKYVGDRILMINLQVTQQCNLRCEYCPYSGGYENRNHNSKRMSFDLAKKGIDFLIDHSSGLQNVAIGFYGGEPLLEFELIKKIVDYAEVKGKGKNVKYTVTTNATLLNKEIIYFLSKHKFSLLISLDGPREIHNSSRKYAFNGCGTFDKVVENIELIREIEPEYVKYVSFNAVVDPQNDLNNICNFFKDYEVVKEAGVMFSQISDEYSKKEIVSNEEYIESLNYQYFIFLLTELGEIDSGYASRLMESRFKDLNYVYEHLGGSDALPDKMHHSGPCIPGVQRLFLNADGKFFPCEKVSETSEAVQIGNIDDGLNIKKINSLLNVGKMTEEKCKECWALRFCRQCVVAADNGKELSKTQKESRCENSIKVAENQLKDICALRDVGYKFRKDYRG